MAIIATKGALDMAYPPLILASTAATLGWDVKMFFTFYGLQLLRNDLERHRHQPAGEPGDADADAHAGGRVHAAGHGSDGDAA